MAIVLLLYLAFGLFRSIVTFMVVEAPLMPENVTIEGVLKRTDVISESISLLHSHVFMPYSEVCLVTLEKSFIEIIESVDHLNSDAIDTIAR